MEREKAYLAQQKVFVEQGVQTAAADVVIHEVVDPTTNMVTGMSAASNSPPSPNMSDYSEDRVQGATESYGL